MSQSRDLGGETGGETSPVPLLSGQAQTLSRPQQSHQRQHQPLPPSLVSRATRDTRAAREFLAADASSEFSGFSDQGTRSPTSLRRSAFGDGPDIVGEDHSEYESALGGRWDLTAHWHLGDYSEGVEGDAEDEDDGVDEERGNDTDLSEGGSRPRSSNNSQAGLTTGSRGIYLDLGRVREILGTSPSSTPIVLTRRQSALASRPTTAGTSADTESTSEGVDSSRHRGAPQWTNNVATPQPQSATQFEVISAGTSPERSVRFSRDLQRAYTSVALARTRTQDYRAISAESSPGQIHGREVLSDDMPTSRPEYRAMSPEYSITSSSREWTTSPDVRHRPNARDARAQSPEYSNYSLIGTWRHRSTARTANDRTFSPDLATDHSTLYGSHGLSEWEDLTQANSRRQERLAARDANGRVISPEHGSFLEDDIHTYYHGEGFLDGPMSTQPASQSTSGSSQRAFLDRAYGSNAVNSSTNNTARLNRTTASFTAGGGGATAGGRIGPGASSFTRVAEFDDRFSLDNIRPPSSSALNQQTSRAMGNSSRAQPSFRSVSPVLSTSFDHERRQYHRLPHRHHHLSTVAASPHETNNGLSSASPALSASPRGVSSPYWRAEARQELRRLQQWLYPAAERPPRQENSASSISPSHSFTSSPASSSASSSTASSPIPRFSDRPRAEGVEDGLDQSVSAEWEDPSRFRRTVSSSSSSPFSSSASSLNASSLPWFASTIFVPRIHRGGIGQGPPGVSRAVATERSNHPRRQCCFLQAGQKFKGTQNLSTHTATLSGLRAVRQTEEWAVKVTISAVDYDAGVIYGLMEAMDVPMSASNVVTFWEGEIIDFENHTFWTKKWGAKPREDLEHWKKLEAFQGVEDKYIIKGAKTGKFRGHIDQKFIFMRWKEKHFVNVSEHTSGLTIAGFYYVSMRRSDGYVEGYYCDKQSTPYQHLSLNPIFEASGFSSSIFEVA